MSVWYKHLDFVREPMKNKSVGDIVGIGDKAVAILNEKGFEKAYHLLGQFLCLSKDVIKFDKWLESEVPSMNCMQRSRCCDCLSEWCEKNL